MRNQPIFLVVVLVSVLLGNVEESPKNKDFIRKLGKDAPVVDLGELQKRGIFEPREEVKTDQDGIMDLTSQKSEDSGEEKANPLGFLGSLAGSSSSNEEASEEEIEASSSYVSSGQKQKLKGVLRDLKDKIDETSRKIYQINEKIELIEKRIERVERRSGL